MVVNITKHRGIALIQVLIISIILTLLAIFISQTVRSQLAITQLAKESYQAKLTLESIEAELLHTLLTHNLYPDRQSENQLVQKWNFYGAPFSYNKDSVITIQDMSSLLSLNYFNRTLAMKLFSILGYQEPDVRLFIDALIDWKDADSLKQLNGAEADYYSSEGLTGPRNGFLQNNTEVLNIRQSNILSLAQWQEYFSQALNFSFNPLNAPENILKALITDEQVFKDIVEQRKQGTLTAYRFSQMTGISSDIDINFYTGKELRIKIVSNKQNSQFSKSFIVQLKPSSSTRAVMLSNVIWNNE